MLPARKKFPTFSGSSIVICRMPPEKTLTGLGIAYNAALACTILVTRKATAKRHCKLLRHLIVFSFSHHETDAKYPDT